MADTLDTLTLPEAKARLGIATADTDHDTTIAAVITAVSGQLDQLVGPVVVRTITTESKDGGRAFISTDKRPVSSVTTLIEYDGTTATTLTAESNTANTANDYSIGDHGIIWRRANRADYRFPTGRRNIEITYVSGRAATTATVGAKYKEAAAMMLRNIWTSELASGSQTFGGITDGFSNPLLGPGLLNKVVALLDGEFDRPPA